MGKNGQLAKDIGVNLLVPKNFSTQNHTNAGELLTVTTNGKPGL